MEKQFTTDLTFDVFFLSPCVTLASISSCYLTTLNETSDVLRGRCLAVPCYCSLLDKAKEYYTADTEATEYAKIIVDYADLHRVLAFFEETPSNQRKLYERRADHCEDLECGLSYSMMLDIKLDALAQLEIDEAPTPHALNKINTLIKAYS